MVNDSEPTLYVSGEAEHNIDCWLAIAHQEKIVSLKGVNGYNPKFWPLIRSVAPTVHQNVLVETNIPAIYNQHNIILTDDLFLASDIEPTLYVSGEAGHNIDCWFAIAHQEKIVSLKGVNGYNPNRTAREAYTGVRKWR